MQALVGFFILFCVYHVSEFVGSNPIWILLAFVLFFIVTHVVAKACKLGNVFAFGFQRDKKSNLQLILGYGCGFLFYGAAMWRAYEKGAITFGGTFELKQMILPVLGMLLLTLLSSASEDLLTRGYPYIWLENRLSPAKVVILTALIYTLNHIWRIQHSYTQWILLFVMGIAFAIPFVVTRSLWFTLGCHWGWNTLSIFKSNISGMSDLTIQDSTTDWTYIGTAGLLAVFLLIISKWLPVFQRDRKEYTYEAF